MQAPFSPLFIKFGVPPKVGRRGPDLQDAPLDLPLRTSMFMHQQYRAINFEPLPQKPDQAPKPTCHLSMWACQVGETNRPQSLTYWRKWLSLLISLESRGAGVSHNEDR